jgi:predicted secreted protein
MSDKDRAMSLVGDLLAEARIKRKAAVLARGECDYINERQMKKDAALFEAAANTIDPSHQAQGWKVNP